MPGLGRVALALLLAAVAFVSTAHAQPTRGVVSQTRLLQGQTVRAAADSPVTVQFALRDDVNPAEVRVHLATRLPAPATEALRGETGLHRLAERDGQPGAGTPVWLRAETPATRTSQGLWTAAVYASAGQAAGDWLVLVSVTDARGNTRLFDTGQTISVAGQMAPPTLGANRSIEPTSVDITSATQTVTASVQLLDAEGVGTAMFFLQHEQSGQSAFGIASRTSGSATDGLWSADLEIPQFAPTGPWALTVFATDVNGAVAFLEADRTLTVTGTSDTQAPTLSGAASVSPNVIDLEDGDVPVTTSFRLLDDRSGVEYVSVYFENGDEQIYGSPQLLSGNALDGVWEAVINVPQNTPPGTYSLTIYATDAAGNNREIASGATLQIGGGDTAAPVLNGAVTLSPTSVDLSSEAAIVTATAPLRDDQSGVQYVSFWLQRGDQSLYSTSETLLSGTVLEGVWEAEIYVPQNTEEGAWNLFVTVSDSAGNYVEYPTGQTLQVGGGDVQAPTISGVPVVTPSSVSLGQGAADVSVRLRIQDDQSGVQNAYAHFLLGLDHRVYSSDAVQLSGDSLDGEWAFTFSIPQNTEPGMWTLIVHLEDEAGNYAEVETAATLVVSGGDVQGPRLTGNAILSPQAVDLTPGAQTVTVDLPMADDTGVTTVYVRLVGALNARAAEGTATRVQGNDQNGRWRATLTVPQRTANGPYSLEVSAYDLAGNSSTLRPEGVTLTVSGGDVEGPALAGAATVDPATLDLTPGNGVVTATVPLSDARSGLAIVTLELVDGNGAAVGSARANRISGTDQNGVWQAQIPIEQRDPPGTYTLRVEASDRAGNNARLTTAATATLIINLPGVVSTPLPADGATDVPERPQLSWQPAEAATRYDLYLWPAGATQPATPTRADLSAAGFSISDTLVAGEAYRWRVVAKNGAGENVGPVWSFTVRELADLVVSSVQVPPTAQSGQFVEVRWTVTNRGGAGTNVPRWYDDVYLSADDKFDPPVQTGMGRTGDHLLTSVQNQTYLGPGESYVATAQVQLPRRQFGPLHIVVTTNVGRTSTLAEGDGTNNFGAAAVQVNLPPTPDLQVTSLIAPPTVFAGHPFEVRWTITNRGLGATYNNAWDEMIYLSRDSVLTGTRSILQEKRYRHVGHIKPDSAYTGTVEMTVPDTVSGPLFVHFVLDANDYEFEPGGEGNNAARTALASVLSPPPDLVVTRVQGPVEARSGEQVQVSWTVTNEGPGETLTWWSDRLYIGSTPAFDRNTAVPLAAFYNQQALAPDASYGNTQAVRVPDGRSGPQYFFVEADWQGRVFEQQFEGNNVGVSERSTQVTLSPWADLEAVSLSAPAVATAGETVPFVWTVRNGGSAEARPSWTDSVFVSTSPDWNPASATFIGLARRIEGLASGADYTQSLPLRLPVDRSGTLYAYVRVDAGQNVYEHTAEGNNVVRSQPITVAAYPPVDLAVGPVSAPVQAAAGDRITVSWTVANNGAGATLARTWSDRLYLSVTDTLTFDRRELSDIQHASTVRGGESYTRTATVKLPNDLATGRYYLIADNTFPLFGSDIVPANNRRASAAIDVTATVPPDLQVTAISVPPTLTAGQPATISWTVRNAGAGAVRDTLWYDAVFLARNAEVQVGTQRLGTVARRGALAADGTYTQTIEATLPFFATGTYYLIVDADGGKDIYEGVREDNNRRLIPVEIRLPAPSDLVVRDVRVSEQAVVGEDVTVSWKLENQGANVAAGRMTSGVYFSTDGTWDVEDALLALDEREINLAPGAEAEFSSKVDLSSRLRLDSLGVVQKMPGVAPGAYRALVRADLRNNIRETDETNNTAASAGTSTVTVPALALGTPVTRDFDYRPNHYFRVDVEAGLDLRLTLSRNAGNLPGGVYVAYNRVPTPSDYDYANANIHEEIRQLVVPSTQAGTYYVLVRGEIIYFEHETFTLLGEAMGFSATNIAPRRGGQGTVTTRLTGAGFRPTSRVVLRRGNATVATAETISVPSTTEMTVRWNLTDVPVGSYRVVVVNADATEAELGEAFEVEPVVTPRLELVRSAPNALLVARRTDYVFQFRNVGNVDIPYASILISVPAGTGVTLETSGRLMSQQELLANAGVEEERAVYVDGASDRFIPLLARDVAPGEALEAKVTVNPTTGGGTEFPIRAFAQLQDKASFLSSHLEKAEQFRRTVLANADAVDPTYVALAQNPADFATFLLDGLVRLGVLHESDIPVALELLPSVQQNLQGAQMASLAPDFTKASPYGLVQPSLALTCEDVFFYTGCLAAALDCLPELAVVPLSAGASAALCVFGLTTGCTPALDVAGSTVGADLSLAGCLGLASALNCVMKELICNNLLFSLDPNDIIGPEGYGDQHWVARTQTLPYTIRFENDPEQATAPAQEVRITLPLHPNLDVRSFRLGSFGFGSFTFQVPENAAFYTTRLDVRDSLGIYVDVSAGLDIETRQAFWTLRSIDPATGTLPNDPFAGFLAINDSLGRGEGFVSYTVRPSPTAKTGDRVEAEASIVFDLNEPILTPPVFNTVDAAAPTSKIAALAEPPTDGRIALAWSAQDDLGGTGVKTYTLYVAEGDGPFRPHATGLTDTRYVYPGDPTASYRFFVLATDFAGNTEAMKAEADVIVVKAEEPAELPTAFALEQNVPNPFAATTTLRFALPEAATVTLEVFNVIGQRVAVLMDGEMQPPGWHTKTFDGGVLASGVYFYRLRAEGSGEARFTQSGKMVLVR